MLQATRLAHAAATDDAGSETAASESMSEVCANMSQQLASVLVKLAEAWTDLLESIPELQLERTSRRNLTAAVPASACSRQAMVQLESQACKVTYVAVQHPTFPNRLTCPCCSQPQGSTDLSMPFLDSRTHSLLVRTIYFAIHASLNMFIQRIAVNDQELVLQGGALKPDQFDVHLAERLLTGPQIVKCCTGGHLMSLRAALQMISFVHALGESKIVHTGHQGLWRSTEAVINAVLDWRHILANPHLPGISSIVATSNQMSLELVLTLATPTLKTLQQWPCLTAY